MPLLVARLMKKRSCSTTNIFDSLNPRQQEAVREIEKPLLIIAGACSK
jgi:hypothetical protein